MRILSVVLLLCAFGCAPYRLPHPMSSGPSPRPGGYDAFPDHETGPQTYQRPRDYSQQRTVPRRELEQRQYNPQLRRPGEPAPMPPQDPRFRSGELVQP